MIKYFQSVQSGVKFEEANKKFLIKDDSRAELIWNKTSEAWICTCGAVYKRAYENKPTIGWCMKCRKEWIQNV